MNDEDEKLIEALYEQSLSRDPDADSFEFWLDALETDEDDEPAPVRGDAQDPKAAGDARAAEPDAPAEDLEGYQEYLQALWEMPL